MKKLLLFLCVTVSIVLAAPKAYIVNNLDNNVSVFETATNTVMATVSVGILPIDVAITPDGLYAYVVNKELPDAPSSVSVINTTNDTVVSIIPLAFPDASAIAISPDGLKAYVTHDTSFSMLSVINISTGISAAYPLTTIPPAGMLIPDITIMPDGSHGYILEQAGNYGFELNISSNNLIMPPISTSRDLLEIAITPDNTKAYMISSDGNVTVFDTATNMPIIVIPLLTIGALTSIAVAPDGLKVYVLDEPGFLWVIDTSTDIPTGPFPITPGQFTKIAVMPDGATAYLLSPSMGLGNIVGIELTTYMPITPFIRVGHMPVALAITPEPKTIIFPAIISYILD